MSGPLLPREHQILGSPDTMTPSNSNIRPGQATQSSCSQVRSRAGCPDVGRPAFLEDPALETRSRRQPCPQTLLPHHTRQGQAWENSQIFLASVSEKVGVGQRGLRLIFPLPQSRKKPPAISLDGEGRRLYLAEPASYCGCKPVRIQLARNNISSWRKEAERMSVA